jgi:hypothetical protein
VARRLEDFVGTYTIRHGEGSFGVVETGFLLCIGTGLNGDPVPDGVRIGVTVVDPRTGRQVLPAEGNPPAFAYLVDGSLNGSTYWLDDQRLPLLLSYQISLWTVRKPDGSLYKAPSIMISLGDPQNAGVWGADDDTGAEGGAPPVPKSGAGGASAR